MERKTEKLEKKQTVSFEELFTDNFMSKYTNNSSIQDFFDKSPFEFKKNDDFEKINKKELDKYVAKQTEFSTWE
ncbi:hypothetical protein [Peribacillus glennii]|nr:hypothetical protein [Peribacillus glennii]